MRIFAIWKKDWRRMWWAVLITTAFLGRLALLDAWRDQSMPSPEEGWLNLLMPLAWAALLAMAVHEDAALGNREYWKSLPVRWQEVIAAKLLFALTALHLPYLIGNCWILQARGLDWTAYPVEQLLLQLRLFGAVSLPAIALAVLLKNLSQVLLVAIAVVMIFAASAGSTLQRRGVDLVLIQTAMIWLGIASVGVIVLQYGRRRSWQGWGVAIVGLVGFISLAVGVPDGSGITFHKVLASKSIPVSVRLDPADLAVPASIQNLDIRANVAIPLVTEGVDSDLKQSFQVRSLSVESADGLVVKASNSRLGRLGPDEALYSYIAPDSSGKAWQVLSFAPGVYAQLKGRRVDIKGEAMLTLSRLETKGVAMAGSELWVPQIGKCRSERISVPWSGDALRVGCESGELIPAAVQVSLNSKWIEYLGSARMLVNYPVRAWLSPVFREESFFHIVKASPSGREIEWRVPEDQVAKAQVYWRVLKPVGDTFIDIEFRGVDLDRYLVNP